MNTTLSVKMIPVIFRSNISIYVFILFYIFVFVLLVEEPRTSQNATVREKDRSIDVVRTLHKSEASPED